MQKAEDPRQEKAERSGRGEKTEFHRQGESRLESNRGYCRLFAGVGDPRPSVFLVGFGFGRGVASWRLDRPDNPD